MNYYIAKDRFGNLDLRHYGVKGMKWGEVHEDPLIGRLSGTGKSLSETNQRMSGNSNYNYRIRSSGLSSQAKVANVAKTSGEQSSASQSSGDAELDSKVAEAEAKYKEALTSMQMMARISLSQGFSPNSDPDYISARKAVIKAKYELDQLRIDQQAKAAQNPPTMAEQNKAMDAEAKEDRKEAKKSETSDDDYAALRRAVINQSFAGREMPEEMKKLRDSKK